MIQKITIPSTGQEGYACKGPFEGDLAFLRSKGLEPLTSALFADARISSGPNSPLSTYGAWVAECSFHWRNEMFFVSGRYNPLMRKPKLATQAHREGKECASDEKYALTLRNRAERDPEKALESGVLLVSRHDPIPTNRFAEDPRTIFLYGVQAKPYGEFLLEHKIYKINHLTTGSALLETHDYPICRPLWMQPLKFGSDIVSHADLSDPEGMLIGLSMPEIKNPPQDKPLSIPDDVWVD